MQEATQGMLTRRMTNLEALHNDLEVRLKRHFQVIAEDIGAAAATRRPMFDKRVRHVRTGKPPKAEKNKPQRLWGLLQDTQRLDSLGSDTRDFDKLQGAKEAQGPLNDAECTPWAGPALCGLPPKSSEVGTLGSLYVPGALGAGDATMRFGLLGAIVDPSCRPDAHGAGTAAMPPGRTSTTDGEAQTTFSAHSALSWSRSGHMQALSQLFGWDANTLGSAPNLASPTLLHVLSPPGDGAKTVIADVKKDEAAAVSLQDARGFLQRGVWRSTADAPRGNDE